MTHITQELLLGFHGIFGDARGAFGFGLGFFSQLGS